MSNAITNNKLFFMKDQFIRYMVYFCINVEVYLYQIFYRSRNRGGLINVLGVSRPCGVLSLTNRHAFLQHKVNLNYIN